MSLSLSAPLAKRRSCQRRLALRAWPLRGELPAGHAFWAVAYWPPVIGRHAMKRANQPCSSTQVARPVTARPLTILALAWADTNFRYGRRGFAPRLTSNIGHTAMK